MSGFLLDCYPSGSTIYAIFNTFGASGESITLSGLATTDIEIYKNGSTTQRSSDNGYALLDTDGTDFDSLTGIHGISIDLSDNSDASFYTIGAQFTVVLSSVTVNSQTVSFVVGSFRIMAAESTSGTPKADVSMFGGTAGTFSSGRPEVNTTHAAGTAWGSGAITAASIASDAITAAKIADGAIDAATFATGAITATAIAADAIGASELAADAATEIGTAVWATTTRILTANTNLNDLNAAGIRSAVGLASANLDTQLGAIDDFIDTEVAAILAAVDTEVGAIKAKTDSLTFSTSNRVDAQVFGMENNVVTAAAAAADLTTELQSGLATAAALATVDGIVDTSVASTDKLDDTLEDNAGTYRFTANALEEGPAGEGGGGGATAEEVWTYGTRVLPANTNINDLNAAGIRSAVGLASANLDTQIGDLPTNAELSTALASADDAVLSAVAGVQSDTNDIQSRLPAALVSGRLDAHIGSVNDVAVTGDGQSGTEWGPA